jgi:IS30 family transposase
MPTTYTHLSSHERDLVAVLRSRGQSLRQIARVLGRDPGTISRELRRNVPPIYTGYYLAHKAQQRAETRNRRTHRRPRLKSARVRHYVARCLRAGWSPELIAGRWTRRHPDYAISHEAIYQWVYAEARHLVPCLVRAHRSRRYRGYVRGKHRRVHIPSRVSIQPRPAVVGRRRQVGHWETDTMISRTSAAALQITVERTARYTRLAALPRKGAREMRQALTRRLSQYPRGLRRSLTYDNGSENTEHAQTNRVLGSRSYFCEPLHSWERGTVENTIGLVRRFFPKRTDLAQVSKAQVQSVERWLNHRPRKCLGFQTPAEVFKAAGVALAG